MSVTTQGDSKSEFYNLLRAKEASHLPNIYPYIHSVQLLGQPHWQAEWGQGLRLLHAFLLIILPLTGKLLSPHPAFLSPWGCQSFLSLHKDIHMSDLQNSLNCWWLWHGFFPEIINLIVAIFSYTFLKYKFGLVQLCICFYFVCLLEKLIFPIV